MKDSWEMNDDELDDLFRKAYQNVEPVPFNKNDWKDMKDRLNGKEKRIQPNKWWLGGTVLFLLIGVYQCLDLKFNQNVVSKTNTIAESKNETKNPVVTLNNNSETKIGESVENEINNSKKVNIEKETLLPIIAKKNEINESKDALNQKETRAPVAVSNNDLSKKIVTEQQIINQIKSSSKRIAKEKFKNVEIVDNNPNTSKSIKSFDSENIHNSDLSLKSVSINKEKVKTTNNSFISKNKANQNPIFGNNRNKNSIKNITSKTNYEEKGTKLELDSENVNDLKIVSSKSEVPEIDKESNIEKLILTANEDRINFNTNYIHTTNYTELPIFYLKRAVQPLPQDTTKPLIETPIVQKRPKWAIRLMYMPELNAGKSITNNGVWGSSIGIGIEYQVLNRLRIRTGITRAMKNYNALPSDYNVPTGFWKYNVKPIGIQANCEVLDIPLTLRYDVVRTNKSDWFIGMGLSSYYMKDETYNYIYDPKYPPTAHLTWSYNEKWGSKNLLGVYEISVGYERLIMNNVGIQIEPYIKIPLQNIGFGQLKLYSAGLNLSIKYKYNKHL